MKEIAEAPAKWRRRYHASCIYWWWEYREAVVSEHTTPPPNAWRLRAVSFIISRLVSFIILLFLSFVFGWMIDHALIEHEREDLLELQHEALAAAYDLTPLEVGRSFLQIFSVTPFEPYREPLTSAEFDRCTNPVTAAPESRICLRDCYYHKLAGQISADREGGVHTNERAIALNRCRLSCVVNNVIDLFGGRDRLQCMARCQSIEDETGAGDACIDGCRERLKAGCSMEGARTYYNGVTLPELLLSKPLRSISATISNKYFGSTVHTIIFWLQLVLGFLASALILAVALDDGEGIVLKIFGLTLLSPMVLLFGTILAFPMWLVIWIGIKFFGGFLEIAGLITFGCTYIFGVTLLIAEIFKIHGHRIAEKIAHAVSKKIVRD